MPVRGDQDAAARELEILKELNIQANAALEQREDAALHDLKPGPAYCAVAHVVVVGRGDDGGARVLADRRVPMDLVVHFHSSEAYGPAWHCALIECDYTRGDAGGVRLWSEQLTSLWHVLERALRADGCLALQSGQRGIAGQRCEDGQRQDGPFIYSYERWLGSGEHELRLSVALDEVVVRGDRLWDGSLPKERVLRVRRPRGPLPRETASGYSDGGHRCYYPREVVEAAWRASRG